MAKTLLMRSPGILVFMQTARDVATCRGEEEKKVSLDRRRGQEHDDRV
jgi:hypothetical protein